MKDSQDIVEKALMLQEIARKNKASEKTQKQMDSKKEEEKGKEQDSDDGQSAALFSILCSTSIYRSGDFRLKRAIIMCFKIQLLSLGES